MKKVIDIAIGERVRLQREILGLSREEFAEKLEISPQFLAEIENRKKGMSSATLYKLCDRFNISADYIVLGRTEVNGLPTTTMELLRTIDEKYYPLVDELLSTSIKLISASNRI